MGEERLKEYKSFDIGDFVSITGTVFKTRTGEVSIHITDFKLIAKIFKTITRKVAWLKRIRFKI